MLERREQLVILGVTRVVHPFDSDTSLRECIQVEVVLRGRARKIMCCSGLFAQIQQALGLPDRELILPGPVYRRRDTEHAADFLDEASIDVTQMTLMATEEE